MVAEDCGRLTMVAASSQTVLFGHSLPHWQNCPCSPRLTVAIKVEQKKRKKLAKLSNLLNKKKQGCLDCYSRNSWRQKQCRNNRSWYRLKLSEQAASSIVDSGVNEVSRALMVLVWL
jgi:ribosomal protein L40E